MPKKIDASHLADVLDLLLDQVADAVVERLTVKMRPLVEDVVRTIGKNEPDRFTTNKAGPHFAGKSRRWMLDHIREMPGATKVGRDWHISADAYYAWQTAEYSRRCAERWTGRPERPLPVVVVDPDDEDEQDAIESLREDGIRFAQTPEYREALARKTDLVRQARLSIESQGFRMTARRRRGARGGRS